MSIISLILNEQYSSAKELFKKQMNEVVDKAMVELRKQYVAEQFQDEIEIYLDEAKRFNVVRVRIRKGKVERRRKVSNLKGYTFRKKGKGPAKLIRMSPIERRRRKISQRRGAVKRRGKMARIQQKMRRVRLKRRSLGLGQKNKVY